MPSKKEITFVCDKCGGSGWEGGTVPPAPPSQLGCSKCGDGISQGSGRLPRGDLSDDLIADVDTIKDDVNIIKDNVQILLDHFGLT